MDFSSLRRGVKIVFASSPPPSKQDAGANGVKQQLVPAPEADLPRKVAVKKKMAQNRAKGEKKMKKKCKRRGIPSVPPDPRAALADPNPSLNSLSFGILSKAIDKEEYTKLEAEAKEAMIASKLAPGYFTEGFDAVAQALGELPADPNPRYLEDRVAEKLLTLQMLNERLYSHIMDNYSDFVGGIEAVSEVEKDLQVAHVLAKNSRRSLAMCSEEVKRNIRIASNAKRKQELFNLLEMLLQLRNVVKRIADLEKGLEDGKLAWTVANTMQCGELVSGLDSEMFCVHELRISVMKILDDTLAKTDDTLQALCFAFDPATSARVLEVYLTLGDSTGLADKIQACFAQAVLGSSHGIIRTYTQMKTDAQQMTAFRNRPYNELCKALSIDQFRSCLLKTFDVLVGVMISHHQMTQWYKQELENHRASNGNGGNGGDGGDAAKREEDLELISVIQKALVEGRKLLFEHIEGRIASLLSAPSAGEGEHFLQVLEWTHCFIFCGESFCEKEVTNLRKHIARTCAKFFDAYHRQNMEALKAILDKELWHDLPIDAGSVKSLKQVMQSKVGVNTFGALPFDALVSQKNKLFAEGTDPVRTFKELSMADNGGGKDVGGQENQEGGATASAGVFTSSSLKVLKYMERYIYLMKVIGDNSAKVVEGFCQLFDLYFWHIFQLFGNVDTLYDKSAPQDGPGALTLRLKKTLDRISRSTSYAIGQYMDGYQNDPGNNKGGAQQNVLSSGNMYGLRERTTALSSLDHIAQEILSSSADLQALAPKALSAQLDSFLNRTVMAVDDLREHVFQRVAKLLVNLVWVPEEIEKCNWAIKDVGMQQHEWVDRLNGQFYQFQLKLDAVGVQGAAAKEFWRYAVSAANESILEGFSRVKKCTIEGRAAMSLDLQMLTQGMKKFVPKGFEADVRLVDGYIKAFYVPESDLLHWAMTHREYKKQQILGLVACIFDANKPSSLNPLEMNKKKKALKELLAEIEANLL